MTNSNTEIQYVWPISPLQKGLFALNKLSQGNDPYHIQFIFRVKGKININKFKKSLDILMQRYPNLKAAFFDEDLDEAIQIIPLEALINWEAKDVDISSKDELISNNEILVLAKNEFSKPFNLVEGNLLRVLYLKLKDSDISYFILTAHHIIIDGWSLPIFFKELMRIYIAFDNIANLDSPANYENYINWLQTRDKENDLNKWRDYFFGIDEPTLLSKKEDIAFNIGVPFRYQKKLSLKESSVLITWCKQNAITINNIFLLAWAFVLKGILNQDNVIFGLTISGRPASIKDVDSMIGLFINTIPCIVRLSSEDSLLTQGKKLQSQIVEMTEYGYLGLTDIQRKLKFNKLFDTLVIFQNTPIESQNEFNLEGAIVKPIKSVDSTHYPLTLVGALVNDTFMLEAETRSDHVENIDSKYIVDAIIDFLAKAPKYGNYPLSSHKLLPNFANYLEYQKPVTFKFKLGLWQMFENNVRQNKNEVAILIHDVNEHKEITWLELDLLSRKIAYLIKSKISIEDSNTIRIGIFLDRNEYYIATILACIQLGMSIVSFDTNFPIARIININDIANISLIVSYKNLSIKSELLNLKNYDFSKVEINSFINPIQNFKQELYTIFTSGSTGEPKGVMISEENILSLLESHQNLYLRNVTNTLGRKLKVGHSWSFAFDASWQPLICFFAGHTIVLLNENTQRDPDLFIKVIKDGKIDFIETSPTLLKHINLKSLVKDAKLKVLGVGGEAIDMELWDKVAKLDLLAAYNFYGPTETTVDAIVANIKNATIPMIGKKIDGIYIKVLDSWLRPTIEGSIGELYIGGNQIARGYLNQYELTASRFIADNNGERLYRTGDLVSYDKEGNLFYHGRIDKQVKIRGFRIELSDVENHILKYKEVKSCKAYTIDSKFGIRLAAAVVFKDDSSNNNIIKLQKFLRTNTANYLIPQHIVAVKSFPMTINGKLDIKALPKPKFSAKNQKPSKLELLIIEKINKLLSLEKGEKIDILEDLRNLGLDSIMVIQLSNLLKQEGLNVTPRKILQAQNIKDLANLIVKIEKTKSETKIIEKQKFALTPIMSWLVKFKHWQNFCQWSILKVPPSYDENKLKKSLYNCFIKHPMLFCQIIFDGLNKVGLIDPCNMNMDNINFSVENERLYSITKDNLQEIAINAVMAINPELGKNIHVIWFPEHNKNGGYIMLFIHHLFVDGVSWRILLDDLQQESLDHSLHEITSFTRWSNLLYQKAKDKKLMNHNLRAWKEYLSIDHYPLGKRFVDSNKDIAQNAYAESILISEKKVKFLEQYISKDLSMETILITVLVDVIYIWMQDKIESDLFEILIDRESHGRDEDILNDFGNDEDDLSRTVGWFTSVVPVKLSRKKGEKFFDRLNRINRELNLMPTSFIEYNLLQNEIPASKAQIEFNYHGILDNNVQIQDKNWQMLTDKEILDYIPEMTDSLLNRTYAIEVNSAILKMGPDIKGMFTRFNFSKDVFEWEDFNKIINIYEKQLEEICN